MFSILPLPPEILLNMGRRIGSVARELNKMGYATYGIDFLEIEIQKARNVGIDDIVCNVDEQGLPWPDNSFEIV